MTRINVIPVKELTRQHLVAEYREITRLPKNLVKSLNRSKPFSMDEIPLEYVLGKGHVKFFYDKMEFLKNRFKQLVLEMNNRGYTTNFNDSSIFSNCESIWFNDYKPTREALELNRKRIKERLTWTRQYVAIIKRDKMKKQILDILEFRIENLNKQLFLIGERSDLEYVKHDTLTRLDELESLQSYIEKLEEE